MHGVDAHLPVVLVVGHEPTISTLASALAGDESDASAIAQARIGMPTGSVAVLSGNLSSWQDLQEESLTLHTIVRP